MVQSRYLKWTLVILLVSTTIPSCLSLNALLNDEPFFIRSSKPEFCHIGCTTMTAMCYQALYYFLGTSISASTAIIVFCNSGGDWCRNGCGHFATREAESVPDPIAAITALASDPAAAAATSTLVNPAATPLEKFQAFLAALGMKNLNGLKPAAGGATGGAATAGGAAGAAGAAAAVTPISMEQKVQALLQSFGIQGADIAPGSTLGILTSLLDPARLQAALDIMTNNANAKLATAGLPQMPQQTLLPLFRRGVEGEEEDPATAEARAVLDDVGQSVAQIADGFSKLIGLGTGSISNAFHNLTVVLTGNTTSPFLQHSSAPVDPATATSAEDSAASTNEAEASTVDSAATSKPRPSLHNLLSESANAKQ